MMSPDPCPTFATLSDWVGVLIGNSRWHWGRFRDRDRQCSWDSPPLTATQVERLGWMPVDRWPQFTQGHCDQDWLNSNPVSAAPLPVWLATVVPEQAERWCAYPVVQRVDPHQLPITGLYPTLGGDRILNLWAARAIAVSQLEEAGSDPNCATAPLTLAVRTHPAVLVIDGGTAMTVSGLTAAAEFGGGAIWPGLRLQFQALHGQTAALPWVTEIGTGLPDRWGLDTPTAMRSGILHGAIATVQGYIQDWLVHEPYSLVICTGGDGAWLDQTLQPWFETLAPAHPQPSTMNPAMNPATRPAARLHYVPQLGLDGISAYRAWIQSQSAAAAD